MTEVKPNTPKICQEPRCGLEMHLLCIGSKSDDFWLCPRNDDAHALCAKLDAAEAKARELEHQNECYREGLKKVGAQLQQKQEDYLAKVDALTATNAALEEKLAKAAKPCEWKRSPGIYEWESSCMFMAAHKTEFCPGCGHPVVVKQNEEE